MRPSASRARAPTQAPFSSRRSSTVVCSWTSTPCAANRRARVATMLPGVTAARVGRHAVGPGLAAEAGVPGVVTAAPVRIRDQLEAPALELEQPLGRLVGERPGHAGVGHPEGGGHDVPVVDLRRVVGSAAAVGGLPRRAIGALAGVVRRAGLADSLLDRDRRASARLGRRQGGPRGRGPGPDHQDVRLVDALDRGPRHSALAPPGSAPATTPRRRRSAISASVKPKRRSTRAVS